ncbi:hypothetical protein, partial [Bilophila sp.]|uniref:hypothetical protein n=1 Tax=Bilophila sp. TaxID=1929485 RepID=UPI0030781C74
MIKVDYLYFYVLLIRHASEKARLFMNAECAFFGKARLWQWISDCSPTNEEVFMNIRQGFSLALVGAVCGALLLASPASA